MGISAGNTVRVWLALLVAALHLAVLMFLLTSPRIRLPAAADSRALTLVHVEPFERESPAVPLKQAAVEPEMRTRGPTGPSTLNIPPSESTAPVLIPDWRGSLETAATAAVGRAITAESYQSLGPVERDRPGASPAPSIFEAPRRKAGDIDQDAVQGRTLIWHNEHCFTELRFPTIKDPNALVGAPNPPKCMRPIGEREARGDLFESIERPSNSR